MDSSEDDLLGLDISWLKEQERLEKVNNNYEKEPMESIELFFIFINQNSFIEKITNEKLHLDGKTIDNKTIDNKTIDNKTHIIRKSELDTIINQKCSPKYLLDDILLFHVNLDPQNIQSFSKSENTYESSSSFVHVLKSIDEGIHIPSSIFIFHRINSLFFIFKEKPAFFIPKSIIKKHNIGSSTQFTKKVRIEHGIVEKAIQNNKKRMTRRNTHNG